MEVDKEKYDFLGFTPKIMVSRDGEKQVLVKNYLQEVKYKSLRYEDK